MGDARDVLFTAREAGPLLGRDPETIRTWFKRGRITSHGFRHTGRGKGEQLFAWGELLDQEESTRRSPGSPGFLTDAG